MPRWGTDRFRARPATLGAWRAIQQAVLDGLGDVLGPLLSRPAMSVIVRARPP